MTRSTGCWREFGPVPTDLGGGRDHSDGQCVGMTEARGKTFWYHLDGLGFTIAMTDESGNLADTVALSVQLEDVQDVSTP